MGKSIRQCYAVRDASGVLHAAQAELKNMGHTAVVPFTYKIESSAYNKVGRLVFEQTGGEYTLSQVYMNTLSSTRPISVSELAEDAPLGEAMTAFRAELADSYFDIPVTENAFSITKANAASIKLVLEDIDKISDIQDTNADGETVYEEYVVRDIYHHVFNITEKAQAAEASEEKLYDIGLCSVESVVYNGQKQGPKVVFNGKVLKEGVDYTWKDWEGSKHYPGDKYTVGEDHTFTAIALAIGGAWRAVKRRQA